MRIFAKTRALLQLIRPELPLAAGICVVVGQVLALGALPRAATLGLGFALGFFLSSSAMVFNDYFDMEVDRVNTPHKPLPAGLIPPSEAIAFGVLTAVTAWILALCIHPIAFAICLVLWVLGFLYNWKLKAAGLWGNLIVSANVAMTFFLGGVSVGRVGDPLVWTFAAIAFVFDLAEEIAGDAMDMQGDRERGSQSIAIRYGRAAALRISGALFAVMIGLTLVPIFLGETGLEYILPIAVMDGIILYFTRRLLRSQTPGQGRRAMRVMYLSATLGLVAFVVAGFMR
ncbi:4-hydroxybenzoate polyprenyltransferase [Longilinea arvoryzae]|uniref:4-hydroxybenzoate polyprenyltransferase n=1 Tax=Longilinea arvoryzae TaxID=360412 RepID=A0A0S7BHW7_9CHLR|nr:UbiA family prenyltransferase [Longilinea arvoryzae]GAP13730.1 4-hydroxybenzoate polyprenyltransferase [Longilinea arvoryzae]